MHLKHIMQLQSETFVPLDIYVNFLRMEPFVQHAILSPSTDISKLFPNQHIENGQQNATKVFLFKITK